MSSAVRANALMARKGSAASSSTTGTSVRQLRIDELELRTRYGLGAKGGFLGAPHPPPPFSEEERDRIVTFLEALPLVLSE